MTHDQFNEMLQAKLDELGLDYEVHDMGFGLGVEVNHEQMDALPADKQAELDRFRVELSRKADGTRASFYTELIQPDDVRVEPGSLDEPRPIERIRLEIDSGQLHGVIVLAAIGAHLVEALTTALTDPERGGEAIAECAERCFEVMRAGFDSPIEAMIASKKAEELALVLQQANGEFMLEQGLAELAAMTPDDFKVEEA